MEAASTLRATVPAEKGNCSADMEVALADRVLAHPAVRAIDVSQLEGWEELGKVFVKAFDDKGQRYPINFDDAYTWLQYGRRDNAIRALRARPVEDTDFTRIEHGSTNSLLAQEGEGLRKGPAPEKYYLTVDAFERFAMAAQTEAGERVRAFFKAIRDAYLELTTNRQQPPIVLQENPPLGRKSGVYISTEVLLAKEKTRQAEVEANARVAERQADVRIAELDHEFRMATLSLKVPRKRSRTSARDRQDVQGSSDEPRLHAPVSAQEPPDQEVMPQAPHPRSTAAVEAVIKQFITEHCTVDPTERLASSSFLERLVAIMYEGQRAPSARAVGVVMHKLGCPLSTLGTTSSMSAVWYSFEVMIGPFADCDRRNVALTYFSTRFSQ
ncbi:hypothetical protein KFL_010390050 [Klebsormidium nitens]|uniref:MSV199 domain-containing protein n=1 Tax=Klebsormidium nitens TaxID=105231 RepID=A0A1Y1IP63_KLENI|nr:hypothetical protein KFL_010390050 [Klebsormidium nitens]|eukprot:GAQ92524.1 hypothetical protein KFL_010390050 [Klebsormidium nitens]